MRCLLPQALHAVQHSRRLHTLHCMALSAAVAAAAAARFATAAPSSAAGVSPSAHLLRRINSGSCLLAVGALLLAEANHCSSTSERDSKTIIRRVPSQDFKHVSTSWAEQQAAHTQAAASAARLP
jgi:hypothetical protein